MCGHTFLQPCQSLLRSPVGGLVRAAGRAQRPMKLDFPAQFGKLHQSCPVLAWHCFLPDLGGPCEEAVKRAGPLPSSSRVGADPLQRDVEAPSPAHGSGGLLWSERLLLAGAEQGGGEKAFRRGRVSSPARGEEARLCLFSGGPSREGTAA